MRTRDLLAGAAIAVVCALLYLLAMIMLTPMPALLPN